jgi:general secretion pathway protein G
MLVVMTIIALFAALVAPRLLNKSDTARVTAARAQINSFMTALGTYKLDTGVYPTTEMGLNALRTRPAGRQPVAGAVPAAGDPHDPWGNRTSTSTRATRAMNPRSSATAPTANPAARASTPTS